jgi:hypothetical protein
VKLKFTVLSLDLVDPAIWPFSLWLEKEYNLSLSLLGKIQESSRQMVLCQLITFFFLSFSLFLSECAAKAASFEIETQENSWTGDKSKLYNEIHARKGYRKRARLSVMRTIRNCLNFTWLHGTRSILGHICIQLYTIGLNKRTKNGPRFRRGEQKKTDKTGQSQQHRRRKKFSLA